MGTSWTSTVFFASGCSVMGFLPPRSGDHAARRRWMQIMSLRYVISDLRQRPEFLDIVADRIWQRWWSDSGHPLEFISGRLRNENLAPDPIPFALIAHDGMNFLGTASVIVSELAERPQLTPW